MKSSRKAQSISDDKLEFRDERGDPSDMGGYIDDVHIVTAPGSCQ